MRLGNKHNLNRQPNQQPHTEKTKKVIDNNKKLSRIGIIIQSLTSD